MREPVAGILAEDAARVEILVLRLERHVERLLENPDQKPTEGELGMLRKILQPLEESIFITADLRGRKNAAMNLLKSAFGNVPCEWHQNWDETTSDYLAQSDKLHKDCDELCTKMEADQSDVGANELILQTLQLDHNVSFDRASRDLRRRLAIDAMAGDRVGESKFEVLRDAHQRLCQQAISSRQMLMSHRNFKVKKPLLSEGEIVWAYSASDAEKQPWQRATIKSHRELGNGHGYGPIRMYTVHFHHKREPEEINDYEVNTWGTNKYDRAEFDRATVSTSNSGCIKRAFDENSKDLWAKQMGWFVALPGEEELHFSRYSDALAAYDTRVIECHGLNGGFEEGLIFDYRWDDYRERAHDKNAASDQAKRRCHFRQRVLFMKEHLPEGDMKLIGDVLVEMTAPDQLLMTPNGVDVDMVNECIAYVWRKARMSFLNGCEQSMRRSVFQHALLKDFANMGAPINGLLMNYIKAAPDIDTFSSDMPHIGLMHDSCSSLDEMCTYLNDNLPERKYLLMHALHPNDITSEWIAIADSGPVQEYLKAHAKRNNTAVKSLRLKYNGRAVFLSNIRDKSPRELGMIDGTLEVTFIQSTSEEEQSSKPKSQSSNRKSKGKKKKQHKKSNKKRTTQPASFDNEGAKLKEQHSQSLSRVFEEADATFRNIRQKLEAMNLERTLPKEKRSRPKLKAEPAQQIDNPPADGIAGKAGKTHFIIQVGETNNLYNTRGSKQSAGRIAWEVDLHGCSQEEALAKLDECLPEWVDTAMKGEYPWVITAKIVCGGGSQVLSEAVEGWIKRNPNVSNAPKNLYA